MAVLLVAFASCLPSPQEKEAHSYRSDERPTDANANANAGFRTAAHGTWRARRGMF